ncbi:hypothetical protein MPLB_1200148 [Mesorhizobium sp. ORS 3324]|nr:hypothetical protein MPLB_1200148 [Mesorhizobium sp. ORS 3324]
MDSRVFATELLLLLRPGMTKSVTSSKRKNRVPTGTRLCQIRMALRYERLAKLTGSGTRDLIRSAGRLRCPPRILF